jgi:hypothetical protein
MNATLYIDIEFDPETTNADRIAARIDDILAHVKGRGGPSIFDDLGSPRIGSVGVSTIDDHAEKPKYALMCADTDELLSTTLYDSVDEAIDDCDPQIHAFPVQVGWQEHTCRRP